MTGMERQFYSDIHKLVKVQEEILKELKEMNKPLEIDDEEKKPMILVEEDLESEGI